MTKQETEAYRGARYFYTDREIEDSPYFRLLSACREYARERSKEDVGCPGCPVLDANEKLVKELEDGNK